jgi:hypothetical protein
MIDRDKKSDTERDRQGSVPEDKSIIPGKHGRHGGSLESEGAPQEPTPEAPTQSNGADERRH